MLETGKLYYCEDHHLMLYPDYASAQHFRASSVSTCSAESRIETTKRDQDFWSSFFKSQVSFLESKNTFLVLGTRGNLVEILVNDKKAWIIFRSWVRFREIHEKR